MNVNVASLSRFSSLKEKELIYKAEKLVNWDTIMVYLKEMLHLIISEL